MTQSGWGGGDQEGWGRQPWGGFHSDVPPIVSSFDGIASATIFECQAIDLGWNAAIDDTDPSEDLVYLIYRQLVGDSFSFVTPYATTGPGELTYRDSAVVLGTSYAYIVRVQNTALEIDDNTTEIDITLTCPEVIVASIPDMSAPDQTRFRKTYSFSRRQPQQEAGGTDQTRFRKTYSFYRQQRRS
jgi:hypothetical protein